MSSLSRSIQASVQEVPAGQMAQGNPPPQRTPRPSKVASTGFINFSMAFFTKSQVKSFEKNPPS